MFPYDKKRQRFGRAHSYGHPTSCVCRGKARIWLNSHSHIQVLPLVVQPLETSPCLQRMATPHVLNIIMESFEEVGDDKGLILVRIVSSQIRAQNIKKYLRC